MNNYLGVVLILALTSCTSSKQPKTSEEPQAEKVVKTEGVKLESAKVQAIYESYIALKNSLVASKYQDAKIAANQLSIFLGDYQGCENTALIAKKIAQSKDLKEQRKDFTYLSSDVIAMFLHTPVKQGMIYVDHCPMANHGEGGDWLSSEKKIENPYYGAEMLECGEITNTLKKE